MIEAQEPEGKFSGYLTRLAADAADALLEALLPAKLPTLLVGGDLATQVVCTRTSS